MPKLIFRLFLSFAVFVTIFILIQQYVKPVSFGENGHYRANAIEDNLKKTTYYKGEKACASCHQEVFDLKDSDLHAEIRCESCHIPKIDANTECETLPPKTEGTIEFCATCHATNPARIKKGVPQLDFNEHEKGKNCVKCHNPHAPWELTEN